MPVRTLGVTVCAVLAVAVGVAGPTTRRRPVFVTAYGPGGRPASVGVGRGEVYVVACTLPMGTIRAGTVDVYRTRPDDVDDQRRALEEPDVRHGPAGWYVGRTDDVSHVAGATRWVAAAPAWAVGPPLALWPARWAVRWTRERRRRRRRRCVRCGYDRRGLSAGGRCPECGTATARA